MAATLALTGSASGIGAATRRRLVGHHRANVEAAMGEGFDFVARGNALRCVLDGPRAARP